MTEHIKLFSRTVWLSVGLILIVGLVGCGDSSDHLSKEDVELSRLEGKTITIYHNSSCGCCRRYIGYLRKHGLQVMSVTDHYREHARVKKKFGIAQDEQSCHTGVIGEYAVEGHVPVEVIARLLQDQPGDVSGVTIPEMPRHAPGMGRPIGEPLEVYTIGEESPSKRIYSTVLY